MKEDIYAMAPFMIVIGIAFAVGWIVVEKFGGASALSFGAALIVFGVGTLIIRLFDAKRD